MATLVSRLASSVPPSKFSASASILATRVVRFAAAFLAEALLAAPTAHTPLGALAGELETWEFHQYPLRLRRPPRLGRWLSPRLPPERFMVMPLSRASVDRNVADDGLADILPNSGIVVSCACATTLTHI